MADSERNESPGRTGKSGESIPRTERAQAQSRPARKDRAAEVARNFRDTRAERKTLEKEQREGKITEDGKRRLQELKADTKNLAREAEKILPKGVVNQIDKNIRGVEDKIQAGEPVNLEARISKAESIATEGKSAGEPEQEDPEKELAGLLFEERLEEIKENYPDLKGTPETKGRDIQEILRKADEIEEMGERINTRLIQGERLPGETDSAYEARVGESLIGTESVDRLVLQRRKLEELNEQMANLSPEQQEQMGGYEIPPRLEAKPQAALDWFYLRLQYLEENFANQSFESRWQLVSPLEQFLLRMTKKTNRDLPEAFEYKGKRYTTYKELNEDLSSMLEARRARHNHTYVFRRVTGTADLIGAAAMLDLKNIETLLHIPEVAGKFRELEKTANEFRQIKLNRSEIDGRLREVKEKYKNIPENRQSGAQRREVENAKSAADEAKAALEEITRKALDIQEKNWAGRIAGGLFSALGEAARYDLQINQSGDFFWNRVKNFSDRAESTIRQRYPAQGNGGSIGLETQDRMVTTLAPAMDLKTTTFLEENITKEKDKKLREYGAGEYEVRDSAGRVVEKGLDLSNFKFENLNFGRQGENTLDMTSDDALKISMLDIHDANEVRKALWDPTGYLDSPTKDNIVKLYPIVKHLKGNDRVGWFKGAIESTVNFNKDEGAPIPLRPRFMHNSLSKRVFGWEPWDTDTQAAVIGSFRGSGLIDKKATEDLLDEHAGRIRRRAKSLLEFLGIIFESLKKGYEAMEKATK